MPTCNAADPKTTADWYLYASPDCMDDWHLDPAHMEAIESIYTVYAFDRNSVTHLCEFTPSYALWFIAHEVVLKEEYYDDQHEALREAVFESVRGASIYNEAVDYYHCDSIDRSVKNHPERLYSLGLFDRSEVSDEEAVDGAHEHWNSNPPYICRSFVSTAVYKP